jgi:hypothetical protein
MLSPGNKKLGYSLIWSFSLPSGNPESCPGMSSLCQRHCYARRMENRRPKVQKAYARNLAFSQRDDFARRIRHYILAHDIRVVRLHVGGDFFCVEYAQKWLWIIKRLHRVKFFFYTRTWRDPPIRAVIEQMAMLPNCFAWYSCDRETGLPAGVPPRIRLAWLMVDADDTPPEPVDLIFRNYQLRREPLLRLNGNKVCPEQDGVARETHITCDRCQYCFRLSGNPSGDRIPLPLASTSSLPASFSSLRSL